MASSRRQLVLEAIQTRLEAITVANGFNTDGGDAVNLGFAPPLGPDDAAFAIAILVGDDDAPKWQGENVFYNLPIEIQAIASVGTKRETPWEVIEALLQDIKRAVELVDRRLGKLLNAGDLERSTTRTLPRESGSSTVGAGITYLAPISEKWGTP